jgi:hypothetical protein
LLVVLEYKKKMQRADFGKPDAEEHGLKSFPPSWQRWDNFTTTDENCQLLRLEVASFTEIFTIAVPAASRRWRQFS